MFELWKGNICNSGKNAVYSDKRLPVIERYGFPNYLTISMSAKPFPMICRSFPVAEENVDKAGF